MRPASENDTIDIVSKLSVVINTLNEEKRLPKALASIKNFADEIVVVDMNSSDDTREIAKKAGARVFEHDAVGYVEPARNFAISKASNEWVFVLDADEEVSPDLAQKIKKIIEKQSADYYRIPRKNFIFKKWIEHSLWWPDYQTRLFKKGKVSWNEVIHSVPMTTGKGEDLPAKEEYAILHNNYETIEQFLERLNRYTSVQANLLTKEKSKFIWKDLISKPLKEFINRFFVGQGYKDGVHGLALGFLQAFSEFVTYLKLWQREDFMEQRVSVEEFESEFVKSEKELNWWLADIVIKSKNFLAALPKRVRRHFQYKNG